MSPFFLRQSPTVKLMTLYRLPLDLWAQAPGPAFKITGEDLILGGGGQCEVRSREGKGEALSEDSAPIWPRGLFVSSALGTRMCEVAPDWIQHSLIATSEGCGLNLLWARCSPIAESVRRLRIKTADFGTGPSTWSGATLK